MRQCVLTCTDNAVQVSRQRKTLEAALLQVQRLNCDTEVLLDRRVVGKLLETYFQRGRSAEVADLMARMLGLSEESRNFIRTLPVTPESLRTCLSAGPPLSSQLSSSHYFHHGNFRPSFK